MEQNSVSRSEKTYAMLCHLLSFSGYLIPLGNILGPLVMWLMKRRASHFVDIHGRESLNFQVSVLMYTLLSLLLATIGIGILLLIALAVFVVVCVIIAALKADNGEFYRYPMTIRLINDGRPAEESGSPV